MASVELKEVNKIFIYFKGVDQSYCMRILPDKLHRAGENMKITLDLNKIYFFDKETENRLI